MAFADFVHLRVHSAYSLSEGAMHVKAIVDAAKSASMPAVAITDTGNLFGALEFSEAAVKSGVQPIMGCIIAVTQDGADKRPGRRPEPDHMLLLAQDQVGWANLMALTSHAFLETESGLTPQVDFDYLAAHSEGLILLCGNRQGPLGRLVAEGQMPAAEELARRLAAMFPGRFYIELQRHGMAEEDRVEPHLVQLAYDLDLPLVATNDCYFAHEGLYEAHDALLCIAGGTTIGTLNRRRVTPEHRFKTAAEMRAVFADLPEAVDNTLVIARRCAVRATTVKPILPNFPAEDGKDEEEALRAIAAAGLEQRLVDHVWTADMDEARREEVAKPYRDRLAFELDVIVGMKFPGYFLIVADFIQWAKRHGIPVGPGRGSGAGSLVAWSLLITDCDPLRFGLLFERFLNPERVSMPDFDIDFCQDRRDEVISYVQQKYGVDRVAQIITFGKLQARAVLRDVGRVMELPYGQVDRLCKMVPNNPANPVTLAQAIEGEPRLQEARESDDVVRKLIDVSMKLEGLYRHASTHAAGVVIGDRRLDRLVPLYRDPRSSMPVTQYNMKWVEQAGLVKFDFLGLKTLTVLQKAVQLLARRGVEVDLGKLALEDDATYKLLARGDTVGVFQLESSGMRDALRKLKPDKFEDIVAMVALYRPGPMDNIPKYIACKHGLEQPDYLHPKLEGVLKETYGVIIYQEQVMQIAQILAGYSLGEADLLRRAMGKKIKAEMDAQRERFVSGAVERGVGKAKAAEIFDLVAKFAGYGFNKSHALAYAIVAYHTAWLKANHPVEFLAASMTLDLGNTDKLNLFRQELDRLKIPLRQPDINRSEAEFAVEIDAEGQGAVRYALAAIKTVGRQAVDAMVAERGANGLFRDLFDFAGRLDPRSTNKRQLENLARAGAFDSLEPNRARTFAAIETLLRHAGAAAEDRASNQESLFGGANPAPRPALPAIPDWNPIDRLKHEFDAIGFYLSAHPIDGYERALRSLGVTRFADAPKRLAQGATRLKLAGTILSKQERTARTGNRFAFVQLSDPSGTGEVTMFAEVLATCRDLLEVGTAVLVTAEGKLEGDAPRLTASAIEPLDRAAASAALGLRIFVEKPETAVPTLQSLLSPKRGGRGLVSIVVSTADGSNEVEFDLKDGYAIPPPFMAAIKSVPGVLEVQER
jgi:DNA polymerase-3 subunit alpha